MRKKHKPIDIEKKLRDGTILNLEDEINIEKPLQYNNQSLSIPLHQRKIQFFEYDFCKSYLYGLYTGMLNDSELIVSSFLTPISQNNLGITLPTTFSKNENDLPMLSNDIVHSTLNYKGKTYQLSLFSISTPDGMYNNIRFIISITGTEPLANLGTVVVDYLIKQALMKSRYKNKILQVRFNYEQRMDITEVDVNEFKNETFDELFVPDNIMRELERFTKCVERFKEIRTGLRYLLSGQPGTGKTKISRIIANVCYKKATIIFASGFVNFYELFEFGNLFEPAIILIDDLDLAFGNREIMFSANGLAEFLENLDGVLKNNTFMLATTNDKNLVDRAAQRPMRFDCVIDFKYLNKDNYLDIIRCTTDDKALIALFDENILKKLEKQKVVGAFLVNLIKQIRIVKTLYPNNNLSKYLNEYLDFSHKGFYQNNQKELEGLGF